jgi:hypothetical protein
VVQQQARKLANAPTSPSVQPFPPSTVRVSATPPPVGSRSSAVSTATVQTTPIPSDPFELKSNDVKWFLSRFPNADLNKDGFVDGNSSFLLLRRFA